jgi:hypothetical protein
VKATANEQQALVPMENLIGFMLKEQIKASL